MVWINGKLRRGTLDLLSRLFEQAHILHNNSSRSHYVSHLDSERAKADQML